MRDTMKNKLVVRFSIIGSFFRSAFRGFLNLKIIQKITDIWRKTLGRPKSRRTNVVLIALTSIAMVVGLSFFTNILNSSNDTYASFPIQVPTGTYNWANRYGGSNPVCPDWILDDDDARGNYVKNGIYSDHSCWKVSTVNIKDENGAWKSVNIDKVDWLQAFYHCHEHSNSNPPNSVTLGPSAMLPGAIDGAWYSNDVAESTNGQDTGLHLKFLPFKPRAESRASVYSNANGDIIDSVKSTTKDDTYWPNLSSVEGFNEKFKVKYCVRMYGPFDTPQTSSSAGFSSSKIVDTVCTGESGQPGHFTNKGQSKSFRFQPPSGGSHAPGYYYFRVMIPAEGQPDDDTKALMRVDEDSDQTWFWMAGFRPTSNGQHEETIVPFQPWFTSKVQQTFIDDNDKTVTDKITSHSAASLADANNGIDGGSWLGNTSVKVCVKAWGPYQQAQDTDYNGGVRIDNNNKVPDGISPKTPIATICNNFTNAGQTKDFIFNTTSWSPGYYYFTEHMLKSEQDSSVRGIIGEDWHSKFNPNKTGDYSEDEATIEKFQLKPTSQTVTPSAAEDATSSTIKTGITGDANHNGLADTQEPDKNNQHTTWDNDAIPVLKPSDEYIEDSFDLRAYDTSGETDISKNDSYWLKDRNGDFVTFYVCATVYGPYQQPQGNGSSGTQRIPTTGIGQTTKPNIPASYNGDTAGRQQCFWTNSSVDSSTTNGLVSKPSESGGPGTYKVRWSNQNDDYFEPGYYYVVWNVDASPQGDCATSNNCPTWVDIGENNTINQRNGEFLESSWWSPFGEQTESFYSQFQPIAKSTISEVANDNNSDLNGIGCSIYVKDGKQYCYRDTGCYISDGEQICLESEPPICSDTVTNNCILRSSSDSSSDNTSTRKKSSVNGGDGGIILECDENKYSNLVNYVDNPEEFPHEKLNCHNVSDQIWLGAVSDKAINHSSHVVASDNNNDNYWPKDKNGTWEPVKFQVKLYGPFAYPYERTPSDTNKAGWAGNNLVTVVPKDTDGKSVEAAQDTYGQPVAQSCVMTTKEVGPNWDGTPVAYDAVFTQDIGSCQGNYPANSSIELTPGFYVSVVEIVRDDIENTNSEFVLPECATPSSSSNPKCATQVQSRPHNMIIEDRFTSAWGERKESLLVPTPLYIITRRDNSAQDTFIDQVTINDQYWIAGFSQEYVDGDGNRKPWTDIWGDPIPAYGDYNGEEGYVATSVPPNQDGYKYEYSETGVGDYYSSDTPGDVYVNLYGAYPLEWGRPNESNEYCVANKLVRNGTWRLPAEDTGPLGKDLPYPAPLTLYEKGWYVFQYTYSGGDRITNIKTQCGDTSEMFRIVKNEIGLVTYAGSDEKTAPTRVVDTVQVTGSFQESDKNSIVKLNLYKREGTITNPGVGNADGAPICSVIFTVDAAGTYSTEDYTDSQGYILEDVQGTGRCWAEDGGHYYWVEEFLRPGSNPLNPTESDYIQPIGNGDDPENIDILPPSTPEVTTDADPTTSVNRPFRDTATVTNIPEGNTKKYYLWFTAYGPFADGRVDCSSQLIYSNESSPITVTANGRYDSDYITVPSNGIVYWVEHLKDEDGNIVDEGECGVRRENTYVVSSDTPGSSNTFEPFQVTPSYPDAGYMGQQLGKIVVLGMMSMLGAWQLTSKKSWLLRKR